MRAKLKKRLPTCLFCFRCKTTCPARVIFRCEETAELIDVSQQGYNNLQMRIFCDFLPTALVHYGGCGAEIDLGGAATGDISSLRKSPMSV
mmetsp:Transcript_22046/g.33453  ORF Transcript_22046/g.33453 Transcript_22046/m.33453 type:complete len:91 (+) Transcript_22046:467-739(+)